MVTGQSKITLREAPGRLRSHLVIAGISLVSLLSSILFLQLIPGLDAAFCDVLTRIRYQHLYQAGDGAVPDITVLALDSQTMTDKGQHGQGEWVTRKPFYDQLLFFEEYFRPSVLSYDFLFQSVIGREVVRQNELDFPEEDMKSLATDIYGVSQGYVLQASSLNRLARLLALQGDVHFRERIASIRSKRAFPVVLAFNFRGGFFEPDSDSIVRPWSDEDIVGTDPDGDESMGDRIYYLNKLRIPPGWVDDTALSVRYDFHVNASTPFQLGYVYLGCINVPRRDDDGVIRNIPLIAGYEYSNPVSGETSRCWIPTFSLLTAMLHLGMDIPFSAGKDGVRPVEVVLGEHIMLRPEGKKPIRIPIDKHGVMRINFDSKFEDYQSVSFSEAAPAYDLTDETQRDQMANVVRPILDRHLVVVSPVATGFGDIGATPLSTVTPRAHVHIAAINNILTGRFIRDLSIKETFLVYLVVFVLFTAVCLFARRSGLLGAMIAGIVTYLASAYFCLALNIVMMPLVVPVMFMGICTFGATTYRYFAEERSRKQVRAMFSTMVSDQVLRYLEENPLSFSLEGRRTEATVFFSDVEGFTQMGEKLETAQLGHLTNSYMTPVTDCIINHGGYLDKYIGDAVMAVWGVPYPDSKSAINCCQAALEQQQLIKDISEEWQSVIGRELVVRMGINTGQVTAGNMGSASRFEYTVMGDTVNTAARLEPLNKDFGTRILIGDSTYAEVKEAFLCRLMGPVLLAGKSGPILVYELMVERQKATATDLSVVEIYARALDCFCHQQWDESLAALDELDLLKPDDGPAKVLRGRIMTCVQDPPDEEWAGVYIRYLKG